MNAGRTRHASALGRVHLRLLVVAAMTTANLLGCRDNRDAGSSDRTQPSAAAGVEASADDQGPPSLAFRGPAMGTAYSVKCWSSEPPALTADEVQAEVDELLVEINRQMSTYDPESELSRFNRAPDDQWFAVSGATAAVVAKAIQLHKETEGALDVTIAPVLRLWRFGAGSDNRPGDARGPSQAALVETRKLVGAGKLHVRRDPPALRKDVAGLQVDLSSIAKGYGVDAVSELLAVLGFENSMVEIGGEVRAAGERPGGGPWRIGIESPDVERRTLAETVALADMAMATSGDYRNYRRADGELVTHIIDPRTGAALPFRGMSVTVLAETCMEADGLATALVVLGDDRAYDWCEEHRMAAMFQQFVEGEVERRATTAFEEQSADFRLTP